MNDPIWKELDPWIAIVVTALVFIGLQMRRRLPVDLMFIGALVAVTVTGVISPEEALENFSNPAVITIAGLLVVAAGLKTTGVLDRIGQLLLGNVEKEGQAMRRIALVLVSTSAFVLNTALVAMTVPVVMDWCRRRNISPSKLLIPVSYFAILGGVCSLIGTSTTLIVNGLLREQYEIRHAVIDQLSLTDGVRPQLQGEPNTNKEFNRYEEDPVRYEKFVESIRPLGLFEISRAGFPVAIAGSLVLLFFGPRLLKKRSDVADDI